MVCRSGWFENPAHCPRCLRRENRTVRRARTITACFRILHGAAPCLGLLSLSSCSSPSRETLGDRGTASQVAGTWAAEISRCSHGSDSKLIVLAINPDGTFDWTGTLQEEYTGWNNLRYIGDKVRSRIDSDKSYEVVACEYLPNSSRVQLKYDDAACAPEYPVETILEAKHEAEDRMAFTLTMTSATGKVQRGRLILHRTGVDLPRCQDISCILQSEGSIPRDEHWQHVYEWAPPAR